MKIVAVVGTRPQFIKAAAVSRVLRTIPDVEEVLVHTGQHYDENMSDVFFKELAIPQPNYDLGVGSGTHGVQTGRMLEAVEHVLLREIPDWVLVYGDTNSTLAGALAAIKMQIPVAHVEAGLRSFNRSMPEEINRVLTDHSSDLLFAPTEAAMKNLRKEGIPRASTHLVGDVMFDVSLYYEAEAEQKSHILGKLLLKDKGYILATVHRAENTDDASRLRAIFSGLLEVSQDVPVVCPLHPRTRAALIREDLYNEVSRCLTIIDPVGYLDMVMLEKQARLIVTDSGGVQKEAFFYRVPCITLRDETEWVELVKLGWNHLVRPESASVIADSARMALEGPPGTVGTPYGQGDTASRIAYILLCR